jgi:hypothetical protein
MDKLPQLVASMTKEEVRHLKLYLSRITTKHDRKDEILFDYIRTSGESYNEDKILKKLYGDESKNAFYRLRGRLQEVICQNLTMLHETKNDKNKLFLYFSAHQIFYDKNNFVLALHFLRRAEKLAIAAENLEMLDMLYAAYIKISGELPEINPELYIEKRNSNAVHLNKLREMDQVLAAVVYRLKLSQGRGRGDENILQVLSEISAKYSADNSLQKSKIFQTKIYRAVSQILLQRHSFAELEKFMVDIYNRFTKADWFDKNNHDTKLQMLVYLVNSFSRNRKHARSLQYAEKLKEEIEQYNRLHYQKYVFYYYNARVINLSETNPAEALKALNELEKVMSDNKPNAYYDMFIQLNRGILYFKTAKYNEAIRSFVKYYTNDLYKQSDNLFKLRVAAAELLMQIESKDLEGTKIRLEQVQKQFKNELEQQDAYAEKKLMAFIKLLCKQLINYRDKAVQEELRTLMEDKKMETGEDNQILNYKSWISSKIKR